VKTAMRTPHGMAVSASACFKNSKMLEQWPKR
jgi:hypothetical protein